MNLDYVPDALMYIRMIALHYVFGEYLKIGMSYKWIYWLVKYFMICLKTVLASF